MIKKFGEWKQIKEAIESDRGMLRLAGHHDGEKPEFTSGFNKLRTALQQENQNRIWSGHLARRPQDYGLTDAETRALQERGYVTNGGIELVHFRPGV